MKRIFVRIVALVAIALTPVLCCGQTTGAQRQDAKEVTASDIQGYRKAAEQGNADAQFNLGVCYESGQGVPQNYTAAVKWTRKAAEQGLAAAQCNLGCAYRDGHGVPQDYVEAIKWFRKAAEQGLAEAQYCLGWDYHEGYGIPKDYTEAAKWSRKAAEQGLAAAQYNLGVACFDGQGVPKDFAEAYKWLNLAAASTGDKKMIKTRDELISRMTPEQITEGHKRAAEFVAKKSTTESKYR